MAKCNCGDACNCSPNNCTCNHTAAPMKENFESGCSCSGCSCGSSCSCDPCKC